MTGRRDQELVGATHLDGSPLRLAVPTVHLNGTSREELERQLTGAMYALSDARQRLQDAAPNARDYYVQGPDAYRVAAEQHADRQRRLAAIHAELTAIFEAVDR